MHTMLSRIAAVGVSVVLTTLAIPMGSAAAVTTSDSCNPVTSVRLLTVPILESEDNRLWIDASNPTRTLVCFDLALGNVAGGAIVVDTSTTGTPPSVTAGTNPGDCGFELVAPSDPVSFRIAIDVPKAMVCLTLNGETVTLAFATGSIGGTPSIEVWRDGTFSLLDIASCPVQWALWEVGGPDTCMRTPARIF